MMKRGFAVCMMRFDVMPYLSTRKPFETRYVVDSMPAFFGKFLFCRSLSWQVCGRTRYAIGLCSSGVCVLSALLQITLGERSERQKQVV
jgi:hypothetical protein